jgi:hypothetical protein
MQPNIAITSKTHVSSNILNLKLKLNNAESTGITVELITVENAYTRSKSHT